ERNTPAFHVNKPGLAPRTPASAVVVTTWRSGGSPANAFGSLQGLFGSAQPSSIDDGARLPWLMPAYAVSVLTGENVTPIAGLKWLYVTSVSSEPVPPPGVIASRLRTLMRL